MWNLKRYLKFFKKEVIFGPFFKLLEAVFELFVPLVMASILDVGVARGDMRYILTRGGLMVALGLVGLGFALICQYYAAKASQGVGTMLRRDLFAHIQRFSHGDLDRFGTSSLITRMTSDINQVQLAVAMLIRLVVRAPFLVIGAAAMAMVLDVRLSLIFLAAAPLIALVLYLVMSRSIPIYRKVQKKLDTISLITSESLEGNRVIRAFSRQKREGERMDNATDDAMQTAVRVGKIAALLNPLTFLIMNGAILAIIWFGGMRVDSGALTQGQIIAFINYMTQILLALIVVANLVVIFTKASASAARINEVFALSPSITAQEGKEAVKKVPGAPKISFRDVCFSYGETGEAALDHISADIYPGQTVGIIGGTGSGKSTLVSLIPRFYDVSRGEVLLDGVNVRQYSLEALRTAIGMVPQQAVLFAGTLEENMRWGKADATEEEIWQALRVAQAFEFVDALPEGLSSRVSQGGKNLSGGQRQRLTIARALVGSPDVLILDDSASALDFATDAALRSALLEHTKDMTVIMVSQRVHTIRGAACILVLDEGRLAGMGTHEELIGSCEAYRDICRSQEKAGEEDTR